MDEYQLLKFGDGWILLNCGQDMQMSWKASWDFFFGVLGHKAWAGGEDVRFLNNDGFFRKTIHFPGPAYFVLSLAVSFICVAILYSHDIRLNPIIIYIHPTYFIFSGIEKFILVWFRWRYSTSEIVLLILSRKIKIFMYFYAFLEPQEILKANKKWDARWQRFDENLCYGVFTFVNEFRVCWNLSFI